MRGACAIALVAAVAACGYAFTTRYVALGGAERVHVRAFENRSTDPELGATLTTALRSELARRGAEAGEGADAFIEGEVRAGDAVPTSAQAATFRVGLEARARLVVGGKPVSERIVRRDAEYLGGADPLESEGWRALALRRAAGEAAQDILRAFEKER